MRRNDKFKANNEQIRRLIILSEHLEFGKQYSNFHKEPYFLYNAPAIENMAVDGKVHFAPFWFIVGEASYLFEE